MINIIKRELYYLIKNPVTYVTIILMSVIVVITVTPYLNPYAQVRGEDEPVEYDSDGDIDEGYIPTPVEERYRVALEELKSGLINDVGLNTVQAENEINMIKNNAWEREKIVEYFKDKYSLNGANSTFEKYEYKHATFLEMQQYLEEKFANKTYTKSFAYKYSEFLSLGSVLATVIVFVILLSRDMRRDIYALLHTKFVDGKRYILGKLISGVSIIYVGLILLTIVVDIIVMEKCGALGVEGNFFDIWQIIVVYNLPNIILTGCVTIAVTLLFKSMLPVIPIMLIYFIYSNMGAEIAGSGYIYILRPLGLFIRYPNLFADLVTPKGAVLNQVLLCSVAVILTFLNITLWERRRNI